MLYQVNAAGQIVGMTGFGWIIAFAPLAFTLFLSFRQHTMSLVAVQTWFWAFTVVMGLSMTSIFVMYTGASVARVFFITASVFGVMSIIGYTTKRDLTGMGSFLMMGLIGMLIAGVVNIFLQSPMMYFIMSLVGVVLAVGLTAYDTQKVKQVYFMLPSEQDAQKAAVLGAFTLYFDFIYLFINLMRLMGERR
jgi:FtsH-binding integral membrane protein